MYGYRKSEDLVWKADSSHREIWTWF